MSFFDLLLIITLSTDITVSRAGSQLKILSKWVIITWNLSLQHFYLVQQKFSSFAAPFCDFDDGVNWHIVQLLLHHLVARAAVVGWMCWVGDLDKYLMSNMSP